MDSSALSAPARNAGSITLRDLTTRLHAADDFAEVIAALQAGRAATIDGAWKSSAALAAAALVERAPKMVLIVLAHPGDVDAWDADLLTFAGQRPSFFPAWDTWPPRDEIIDETAGGRLRLLKQLDGDAPPRLILTTMQALLQPVPSREQLTQQKKRLKIGTQIDPEELAGWLVDHGFQRMDAVELPGEFSQRGGIFDIFSPDAEVPYRIDFFGDEVESIRQFSPETQRSLGDVDVVEITSAATVFPGSSPSPPTPLPVLGERGENRPSPPTPLPPGERGEKQSSAPLAGEGPGEGDSSSPLSPGGRGVGVRGKEESAPLAHLSEWLPPGTWIVLHEPEELREQAKVFLERAADMVGLFSIPGTFQQLLQFPSIYLTGLPSASMETTCHLRIESVERFSGDVNKVREELDSIAEAGSDAQAEQVMIACHNEGSQKRLAEVLGEGQLAQSGRLHLVLGRVHAGFRMVDAGLAVIGDHELFHRDDFRTVLPRRRLESRAIDTFLDLREGDLVVHVSHGIARYRGLEMLKNKGGQQEEHLILEFRGGTRVYVPASKIDLVQKYIGGGRTDPELSKLGGTSWQRKKEKVAMAVIDLAAEMIELQAIRESKPGIACPPDTEWQLEFEAAFPYEETPDQLTSLHEIKKDMQKTRPMDRLICGDVGYGKTELAIRAAFKAVDNGKQVAVLVPTTVLAEQHFRTFSARFAEYPFVVEAISRFRSGAQQRRTVEKLAKGGIDVIIGTHRLLSADVKFKELGLVIIDEEQRFGVEHKERLKKLRQTVDVLTMTATPIPRTLHLSLLGIRDISNLETPPRDRLAIETRIVRFDDQLIRHAILRELNRDGQIYFVHNRVQNIQDVADKLQEIVPEARIVIGHGQMNEHELEKAMVSFVNRKADILVATTIIESGLDIPNANTMFINQAEMYGLADLHQLRGRVGRYKHRAYCYLLLDPKKSITDVASQRLKAIEEFTELGAGFKIAMRDLEIRGAGNILGTQQSGHIAAVGYEMYCQLLENAVRQFKHLPLRTPLEVDVDLPWPAFLPRDYIPGQRLKIEVYRRLARVRKLSRLEDFRNELTDRFGKPSESVEWLLRLAEIRLLAARWQIASIRLEGEGSEKDLTGKEIITGATDIVLEYRNRRKMKKLAERSDGRLRVVDEHSAYFRLTPKELKPMTLYKLLKHLLCLS